MSLLERVSSFLGGHLVFRFQGSDLIFFAASDLASAFGSACFFIFFRKVTQLAEAQALTLLMWMGGCCPCLGLLLLILWGRCVLKVLSGDLGSKLAQTWSKIAGRVAIRKVPQDYWRSVFCMCQRHEQVYDGSALHAPNP